MGKLQHRRNQNKSKSHRKLATSLSQSGLKKNTEKIGEKNKSGEQTLVAVCTNFSLQCGMRELKLIKNTYLSINL